MAIKFFTVVLYFMHLKFDNQLFTALFYMGLGLAVFVYTVAMFTFHVFDLLRFRSANRSVRQPSLVAPSWRPDRSSRTGIGPPRAGSNRMAGGSGGASAPAPPARPARAPAPTRWQTGGVLGDPWRFSGTPRCSSSSAS